MQTLGYDLLLIVIDAIVASIISIILTKALIGKSEKQVCDIDRGAVTDTIILVPIPVEQDPHKVSALDKNSRQRNLLSNNISTAAILLIAFLIVYYYLRYESQITIGIIVIFILLESFCLTTAYLAFKKCAMSMNTKKRVMFNFCAALMAVAILLFQKYPIHGGGIDKAASLEAFQGDGIVGMLFGEDYLFLLAQAIGLIILVFYMLQILKGALHILAMVNLALGKRMTKLWLHIWKFTDEDCRKASKYYTVCIVLMLLSLFLVSGIFIEFVLIFSKSWFWNVSDSVVTILDPYADPYGDSTGWTR